MARFSKGLVHSVSDRIGSNSDRTVCIQTHHLSYFREFVRGSFPFQYILSSSEIRFRFQFPPPFRYFSRSELPKFLPSELCSSPMSIRLTTGAISAIDKGDVEVKPVVKVVDVKIVSAAQGRYSATVTDGSEARQALLASQLNELVRSNELKSGSIVQLLEYTCAEVQNRRFDCFLCPTQLWIGLQCIGLREFSFL